MQTLCASRHWAASPLSDPELIEQHAVHLAPLVVAHAFGDEPHVLELYQPQVGGLIGDGAIDRRPARAGLGRSSAWTLIARSIMASIRRSQKGCHEIAVGAGNARD
jgi:hypothetical protein